MKSTFQFKEQSVWEHGQSVNKYFTLLIDSLNKKDDSFPVPDLLKENWGSLKSLVYSPDLLKIYHVYHDCGKPYCLTVDADGKKHFPNHAEKSTLVFRSALANSISKGKLKLISKLILNDMVFHSETMENIEQFLENNRYNIEFLFTLWLSNLSELYSNSQMFGGYESVSFKIKYKKLDKIFKKLYNLIKKD